ncbi:MAG: adenylyltransferase/cytidyltransferase family protein, partial [Candidatus Aminicenantes bacterium]|nr:adenylyltransferase/cytidyltransferase family protein [Candidatus Aminicenantes bacterium]
MKNVAVLGSFDDLRSGDIRFLEEAAKLGELTAFVRDDEAVSALTGKPPKFPAAERLYVVSAIKYVSRARIVSGRKDEAILIPLKSSLASSPGSEKGEDRFDIRVVSEADALPEWKAAAASAGIEFRVIRKETLRGFPGPSPFLTAQDLPSGPGCSKKKAIVTGCYDFFHSGHVRFFEEASAWGDLYVDVGSDANIRLLKGGGHPLFPEAE